ncbi:MAG: family 10 glycosylhydrolase [candidate division KSB1 bacterium]|nr:family 10 glycosylhydrolase [candidate division KSB1 bacterium]
MRKTLTCLLVPLLPLIAATQTLRELRAVKLTNVDSYVLFDDAEIARAMDFLATHGFNAVLPVVWNGHGVDGVYTLYPSRVMERVFGRPIYPLFSPGRDPLERVVIEAHRNGMEVYPWFEMGFSCSYSQAGGYILRAFPEWALRDNTGALVVKNGFDWMSGINPEVQALLLSLVTEIVDRYDVDGVEFSDRIPAMPVEGGYDRVTAQLYAQEHGGSAPPSNCREPEWMRWRAQKLTEFYRAVRDSVKRRGRHLIVSSSPSAYPWAYQEYLQDPPTWLNTGIIDNVIPQLYRYTFADYLYELNSALSYVPAAMRDRFFSGILIYLRGENYLITPGYLLQAIKANRAVGVRGEALFFYEGLRQSNGLLADTLRSTVYCDAAQPPRGEEGVWRPPALIVHEDGTTATRIGTWEPTSAPGFRGKALFHRDTSYAAVEYEFDVPVSAWYHVFAFIITGTLTTDRARFTVYSAHDTSIHLLSQRGYLNAGWRRLSSAYLSAGRHTVVKIDNHDVLPGDILVADATMIMVDRTRSPEAVFTAVSSSSPQASAPPRALHLRAYPNPVHESATLFLLLHQASETDVKVYDLLGRCVLEMPPTYLPSGQHTLRLRMDDLPSGLYFCRVRTVNGGGIAKILLAK